MPSVQTTQTVTVKLTPALRRKLLAKLHAYQEHKMVRDAADAELKTLRGAIEGLFVDADEVAALKSGAEIDGFKTRLIQPSRSSINKKKLVAMGVSLDEVTDVRPGTPYVKVTVPGEKDEEGD